MSIINLSKIGSGSFGDVYGTNNVVFKYVRHVY